MNRLTERRKYPNGYEYQIEDLYENTTDDCVDKLGKLEDLEEELGCSLEEFVRAIKEWSYFTTFYKEENDKIYKEFVCVIHELGMEKDFEMIKRAFKDKSK